MPKYVVATVDEIPPGQRKIVTVERRSIGVFNIHGDFYAIRNQCPHEGGPLCEGVLSGLVRSDVPGEYDYIRRGEIVRCPWHQWEFDVRTGQSWFDPAKTRVRAYETSVEPQDAVAGYVKGPYEAETYRVEVDREYVVIDV
ncbi:Rieske (2Fe-2S) protein [Actinopolymorpha pittospori]|jgi:nitrite reductase/ring-hydroxylating ferredoxin subunit